MRSSINVEKRLLRRHRSGWALLLGAGLVLASTTARAADPAISDEARMHFKAGVNYLQDPDGARFEEAYTEFKTAYGMSQSPKMLGNMGYCAMKLERDGEAIDNYTQYLKLVDDVSPEERAQIQRDLYTLTTSGVAIAATTNLPSTQGEVRLRDSRTSVHGEVINLYGPMPNPFQLTIRPGHHSMELMAGGEVRARWEFDAAGGARLSHAFRYEPPVVVSARRPSKTLPWVTIAVGAAGLAAGTITGALALGHLHSLNGECAASGACPPSSNWQSDKSAANTFANVSTYTLIGGGVVAAAGIVWLIVATVSPPSSGATTGASGGGSCMGRGCDGTLQFRF